MPKHKRPKREDQHQGQKDEKKEIAKRSGNFSKKRSQAYTARGSKEKKDVGAKSYKNNSSSLASTSTCGNDSTDNACEIPGFYYDRVKKKYFKILPGHHASKDSSVITRDVIKKNQQEEERLINLKKLTDSKSDHHNTDLSLRKMYAKTNCIINYMKKRKSDNNIYSCIDITNYKTKVLDYEPRSKISRNIVKSLKPFAHRKIFNSPSNSYEKLEHMQKMYASRTNPQHLVCLWSLRDLLVKRIQMISVNSVEKTGEDTTNININVVGAMIPKAFSKITSMCSATLNNKEQGQENILFTTMCEIGNNPSLAMLRNLNCTSSADFRITEFNLSTKATWCCAWNPLTPKFSVGTEKSGLLLDVQTRKLWELNTDNSDVLCQTFTKSGDFLYSGTRRGNICCHDLRSRSTYPVNRISHKSPVCHVEITNDDNYLIASDFNNQIKKWDIRQRKVILQYKGHVNNYSVIPFHINSDLGILYAAGQDCYSRIWDLNFGELLRTIPPPHEADVRTIPTLCYSSQIGKYSNRPGLIMGMLDEIHMYSF